MTFCVRQVRLYSLSQQKPEFLGYFPLFPDDAPHVVGSMAWGLEATSSHLFASSEPIEPAHLVGTHKAFDIQKNKVVYQFDAAEAGDTLCVGPTGMYVGLHLLPAWFPKTKIRFDREHFCAFHQSSRQPTYYPSI